LVSISFQFFSAFDSIRQQKRCRSCNFANYTTVLLAHLA